MPKRKRYYDKMMEKSDGGMMGTSSGHANMPSEVIMKYYPKDGSYLPENLNDGISGVDSQKSSDVSGAKKNPGDSKY